MKTKNICSAILLGMLLAFSPAFSQQQQEAVLASAETTPKDGTAPVDGEEKKEEEPKLSISGSIDVYAHTSFGKQNEWGTSAPTTSFANLKGFSLGMANIILSYAGEKAGFTGDLVFGPRGSDAVFNSGAYVNLGGAGSGHIINQLFAYYKLSDHVTFNLGQFNTFLGYEVISPTINVNYSTSYLFSNGPFNHTGFRADFSFGSGLVAKVAVMNPTDWLEFNHVNTYTLGAQFGKTSDAGGVWLNVLYGDQDGTLDKVDPDEDGISAGKLFQVDLTTGWNLGDKFYLGANASLQSIAAGETLDEGGDVVKAGGDASSFYGVALYPKLTLSESFVLGARIEYFSTQKGHVLASPIPVDPTDADAKGSVTAFTLSGNYKVGGLTIIPEFRYDSLSEKYYLDSDGKASNGLASLTLAAVYKF